MSKGINDFLERTRIVFTGDISFSQCVFTNHPANGTQFKGYQLPDWPQLQSLVREAAAQVPRIKFIGGDLAHTDRGWIFVEGNENCYIIAHQMIEDKGMRSVFESLMRDMDLVV